MKKEEILSLYQDEVQTSVSVTSFMTGVTIFFTGLLITKFDSYDISIKIPILFLILSTFGFLYSTLIYANSSGELSRLKSERFNKNMNIGDSIGEYIGVYFLVLAIPLVINVITADNFLKIGTLIAALGGLSVYHISGFSIMQDHYHKMHYMLFLVVVILEIILYLTQKNIQYFIYVASFLILYLFAITFFSRNLRRK
ncbi:MAG: hypothetical protein PHH54_05480 [Candidatus Nanoarchaeia archaeon]|nr:hypothetical protein [Candidatus Nanoarchaeia archaeon]MDD5741410.1 hypothetical protein [Candidatus Nanoarchaeia archaeon]